MSDGILLVMFCVGRSRWAVLCPRLFVTGVAVSAKL